MDSFTHSDCLHVVYISRLASSADYRAFAAICRSARARNPVLGVGGVLLFDGERFCQWLHGDPSAVQGLMATITLDHRHTDLRLLHHATIADDGSDSRWCSGFVLPDALDMLDRSGCGRNDVMGSFLRLLTSADLEPSVMLHGAPELPVGQSCRGSA